MRLAMTDKKNETVDSQPSPGRLMWYRIARRTSWIFATLAAAITILLIVDFITQPSVDRRLADSPLMIEMRQAQLDRAKESEDPHASAESEETDIYRIADAKIRAQYFSTIHFRTVASIVLAVAIALSLIMAEVAGTIRPPMPDPTSFDDAGPTEAAWKRAARWSVSAAASVGVVFVAFLYLSSMAPLQTAAIENPPTDNHTGNNQQTNNAVDPVAAKTLTEQELAGGWLQFRGPGGSSISQYTNLPTTFDVETGKNIAWKVEVPLPGMSSPLAVADRVYVTGATGENTKEPEYPKNVRELYCFDAATGEILWQVKAPSTPESEKEFEVDFSGYAAPTPVVDADHVYAHFGNGDLMAVDHQGNIAWSKSFGIPEDSYGRATSLLIVDDKLIVLWDEGMSGDGKSKIVALSTNTGETIWETPRECGAGWASPILIDDGEQRQIITNSDPFVIAYDPEDGKELWRVDCLQYDIGPSPVYRDGTIYVVNQMTDLSAIAVDGRGDVTESKVKWHNRDVMSPDTVSPLATDKYVFLLDTGGTLTCVDRENGEILWEEDYDSEFNSTPILVGDLLYLIGLEGQSWIVRPGPDGPETVGEGNLGQECVTSPAPQDGCFFVRGKTHLFKIESTGNDAASEPNETSAEETSGATDQPATTPATIDQGTVNELEDAINAFDN